MKKLLTTSAILLATTFAANANSNEDLQYVSLYLQSIETQIATFKENHPDLDEDSQATLNDMQEEVVVLEHVIAVVQHELETETAIADSNLAVAQANQAVAEAELVETQTTLEATQNNLDLYTAYYTEASLELDDLQDTYAAVNSKYISLADSVDAAENKAYMGKGDIFKLVVGTEDYEAKNASYDPGSSATTFSTDLTNGSMSLSNVTLSGKYHNFSINTDITADNLADRVKLEALVSVINDKAYNEGYKDGFNDGYEIGFNNGYGKAVSDIRAAESPL